MFLFWSKRKPTIRNSITFWENKPKHRGLHSFVKRWNFGYCQQQKKWSERRRERMRLKKNYRIWLKYVWQRANCSTSAFCIVVDNRYRIPLPKRIQNVLSRHYLGRVVVVTLFVFRHHQNPMEKDMLRFGYDSKVQQIDLHALRSVFFSVPHIFKAIVGQFPNKMHFISDILSKCYNNNFYNDILVCCAH